MTIEEGIFISACVAGRDEITKGQVRKYVASDGALCPKCGSANIQALFSFIEDDARRPMECLDCHFEWDEVYRLVGIYVSGQTIIVTEEE